MTVRSSCMVGSVLLVLLVLWSSGARAAADPALGELDRGFACPESLSSDDARFAALRRFVDAYKAARPQSTPGDMLLFRRTLLEKHACRRTLARLAGAAAAVRNGDMRPQAWLPIDESGPARLFVSTDHLVTVFDPRFPRGRTVDAYTRLVFPAGQTTNVTHVAYDELISHTIYYCAYSRYALAENDYFRVGRMVR